jgi:uncharacterized protein
MTRTTLRLSPPAPGRARYDLRGIVGDRLHRNRNHWLLTTPLANPAMLEMFRDRDRLPRRDLVPWAGEFAGKYLTSAVLCWRLDRDPALAAHLAEFVDEFIATQDEDGYLGPFPRHERLTGHTMSGERGLRALWDLWGHYHAILGLGLYHLEFGYAPALQACLRAADHLCAHFLEGDERPIDAGAEEMNLAIAHGLAWLYQQTGEPRYLQLVREIERDWETPPAGDYVRQALADVPFFQTPKPRWESLHDIQAILSLYEITGEARYRQAFIQIWRSIPPTDIHNTGGFTSGEKATGNPYDPGAIETCCTVAWMALSVDMLRLTGEAAVADEIERSFYNAALGAQSTSGRWWTYNTPMDGVRRASAHDIVFQAREGSSELNCCSVNGPRALGMLSEWAVMLPSRQQINNGLMLNYYGPGTITVDLPSGQTVTLTQETAYPLDGHVRLSLSLAEPTEFALSLRIPEWSRSTAAALNGQPIGSQPLEGGYLRLNRIWQDGDTVSLDFDLSLRILAGEREAAGKISLFRGPLLLAYDRRYNAMDPDDLPAPMVAQGDALPLTDWDSPTPAPWMLVQAPTADGRVLRLCDFASAGAAGTPYCTWLPSAEAADTE